eukprot:3795457-Pleurochrysis_carterae.AAC.1
MQLGWLPPHCVKDASAAATRATLRPLDLAMRDLELTDPAHARDYLALKLECPQCESQAWRLSRFLRLSHTHFLAHALSLTLEDSLVTHTLAHALSLTLEHSL